MNAGERRRAAFDVAQACAPPSTCSGFRPDERRRGSACLTAPCLCPGITDTTLFRYHVSRAPDPQAVLRERMRRVPLGRFLTPRDIARAALYLSCADSDGITGTAHVVDGGYLAAAEWNTPEAAGAIAATAAPTSKDHTARLVSRGVMERARP